jgi:hypothetical protein
MNHIKWIFLFFALLAASSMMGIGIAIAERSMFGIIFCIITLMFVMGISFSLKRKWL